jgi:hypothetical protein
MWGVIHFIFCSGLLEFYNLKYGFSLNYNWHYNTDFAFAEAWGSSATAISAGAFLRPSMI